MQVSPGLYGDRYPRFFTYWTVSKFIQEKEMENYIMYNYFCFNCKIPDNKIFIQTH